MSLKDKTINQPFRSTQEILQSRPRLESITAVDEGNLDLDRKKVNSFYVTLSHVTGRNFVSIYNIGEVSVHRRAPGYSLNEISPEKHWRIMSGIHSRAHHLFNMLEMGRKYVGHIYVIPGSAASLCQVLCIMPGEHC